MSEVGNDVNVGGGGGANADVPADPQSLQELTELIQNLLSQTQDRFQNMSDQIVKRIDDMGRRIDDLEGNINELMVQVGMDQQGGGTGAPNQPSTIPKS